MTNEEAIRILSQVLVRLKQKKLKEDVLRLFREIEKLNEDEKFKGFPKDGV